MFGFNNFIANKLSQREAIKAKQAQEAAKSAQAAAKSEQLEALLSRETLGAAWSLVASHADSDEKWLELFFRDRLRRGGAVGGSHPAITLLEAIAIKSEDAAHHIIEQSWKIPGSSIREIIEPAWAANFMLTAMRVGMESAAESFIEAAEKDVELMEAVGLAGALPNSPIGGPALAPSEDAGRAATPLVEALLIGCDGVARQLISANVDLLPSAMSPVAREQAKALNMDGMELGFAQRRVLALAIGLQREEAQQALVERLRDAPESAEGKVLFELSTLRAAIRHGQKKTARIVLRGVLDGLAPRLAEEELSLCRQGSCEPTLWTMIIWGMCDAAEMLIEAWSRAGSAGLAAMNLRAAGDSSALNLAISLGKTELAVAMIDAGADLGIGQGLSHRNMADFAAMLGEGTVLAAMLNREKGSVQELLGGNEGAVEMLREAINKGKHSVASALIRAGAPLPEIDAGGRRMMAISWAEDSPEMMSAVLDRLGEMPMSDRTPFLEEMDMGRGRLAQALASRRPGLAIELLKLGASDNEAMSQIGHHAELGDMLIALRSRANAENMKEAKRPGSESSKAEAPNPTGDNIGGRLAEKVAKARARLDGAKKSGLGMSAIPRGIGNSAG